MRDAAEQNLVLFAFDFGPMRYAWIPARLALAGIDSLDTLEALVFCVRFGGAGDGLTRAVTAGYLRLPVKTIARVEYQVVDRLGLVEEVA